MLREHHRALYRYLSRQYAGPAWAPVRAVLGDTVRAGWAPAALVGVGFAIAGCVALALSPTQRSVGA